MRVAARAAGDACVDSVPSCRSSSRQQDRREPLTVADRHLASGAITRVTLLSGATLEWHGAVVEVDGAAPTTTWSRAWSRRDHRDTPSDPEPAPRDGNDRDRSPSARAARA